MSKDDKEPEDTQDAKRFYEHLNAMHELKKGAIKVVEEEKKS